MIGLASLAPLTVLLLAAAGFRGPARMVDRVALLGAAFGMFLLAGSLPTPDRLLLPASTLILAIGCSWTSRVTPLTGWAGLWLVGAAATLSPTLSGVLTWTTAALVVAVVELVRLTGQRRLPRRLLLPMLVGDLPLVAAFVGVGQTLPDGTPLFTPGGSGLVDASWSSLLLGLATSAVVRLGGLPLGVAWLDAVREPRPATRVAEAAVWAIAVLPSGLVPLAIVTQTPGLIAGWAAPLIAAAVVSVVVAVIIALGARTTAPLAVIASMMLATVAIFTPVPLYVFAVLPPLAFGCLRSGPAIEHAEATVLSELARDRVRIGSLTQGLTSLPLGAASGLTRFLDWVAVRQLLALRWLPIRVHPSTTLWAAAFAAALGAVLIHAAVSLAGHH